MKKILLAFACLFIIVSCQDDNNLTEEFPVFNTIDESKLDDFKGLKFQRRYTNNVASVSMDEELITDDELFSDPDKVGYIMDLILPNFPYFKEHNTAIQMIQSDFPTLNSLEIGQNIGTIEEFYENNLENEFVDRYIKEYINSPDEDDDDTPVDCSIPGNCDLPGGGGDIPSTINSVNIDFVSASTNNNNNNDQYENAQCIISEAGYDNNFIRRLKATYALWRANFAVGESEERFPNLPSADTKRDAFRHILWSSLLARNFITLVSRQKRVDFATAIGDANEICNVNALPSKEMDLHNNWVGRDNFVQNTDKDRVLGIPVGLDLPSRELLINSAEIKVLTAKFIDQNSLSEAQILTEIQATIQTQAVFLSFSSNSVQCSPGYSVFDFGFGQVCCREEFINGLPTYVCE